MKDLLMSCKVECPPVSRDLLNGWVNRSSERNQQGNWSSVLEPNCSRGYVCVWAECWIMTRTQMKQWQWRPHLPFCSCREQGCVAQAEALAPPGISICSDSTGLQPRCGNKTIFPGEIQTVYFLCFWRCWDRNSENYDSENVLGSFSSVQKHGAEPTGFCRPWSCHPLGH